MRMSTLFISFMIILIALLGCSKSADKPSIATTIPKDTYEQLKEDSAIWTDVYEMNDSGNYEGLSIEVERVLISPSSSHIAIKGSMLNTGQSSFEAYPAVETIKLNTGEELGAEEVIPVKEEGKNELNQKGDRLDFFYVWPLSYSIPNEVNGIEFSWRIFKNAGNNVSDATTFTRKYTLNQ
ncbi:MULTISPECIES: hypothetical protein [Bacillus]|uniref:hypothetical protein n=1 Tax=Bacillus TaxID=1386 RepID=UPI000462960E|nr:MULTISPECIES: hypothetical protein [Bacillus]ATH73151.1 hypothetical protein CFN77_13290 [Bacillus altitudinis]